MESKENIIKFKKNSAALVDMLQKAIEAKDYWKAQRILRSLQKQDNSVFLSKIAVNLHLQMQGYQNLEEDFLPLLFSHDFDLIMFGARGLVQYFLPEDEKKAEFYSEFLKNRLHDANVQIDDDVLEEVLAFRSKRGRFAFVEKQDDCEELLKQADNALAVGQLDIAISSAGKVPSNNKNAELAKKIASEAYLRKKDIKNSIAALKEVSQKDVYYYSILTQIEQKQNSKNFDQTLNKLLSFEVNHESELMIILDALLSIKKYSEAEKIIAENEKKFEYFCPIYLAKWLIAYAKKDIKSVKENLLKACLLDKRRVVEQEILWCIEEGEKLPSTISIDQSYPQIVVERAKQKLQKIMEASIVDLALFSKNDLENGLLWIETFGADEVALSYVQQLLLCKTGVELIKECLLSFVSPDWLKQICICALVEAGANDITIWYNSNDMIFKSKILIPDIIMKEVYGDALAQNGEILSKFMHAYGMTFAKFCMSATNFEIRLQEVGEEVFRVLVSFSKNKKLDETFIMSVLLFCCCSDKPDIVFATPKVLCSQFSTIENVCAETGVSQEKLQDFIKNVL